MKKGSEYAEGEMLMQGPYVEPIRLVWSDDAVAPNDVFLVVGKTLGYLTVYVVKDDLRMAPRLARFIPMELLREITELKDVRVRKGRKRKAKNVLDVPEEQPMPAPERKPVKRRRKPKQSGEEAPVRRKRRQRRKSDK